MPRLSNSTQRRRTKSDSLKRRVWAVIRPYSACVLRGILCQTSKAFDHCVECYRIYRRYKLASSMAEVERLGAKVNTFREQRLEAERKAIRLRK
jgi:hypothetical protein